ncbi:hypothetical protein BIV57_13880 [Mangrovactinospora gilvigrisea]|uniref:TraD/TraG TraM recognition site domain-containing protein n=1 Tax=Mangrovactinospora gilvigrisea TaxID=1428644 RepID=A0A1J7C5T8_9ACTN|nr:TraM recognition domain-containing protein [Mangrovactinospora gilvigrisea]OIV36900.1 hypothetical protein BIV57_13880 [Mangrovactinospora gilvigrisea]
MALRGERGGRQEDVDTASRAGRPTRTGGKGVPDGMLLGGLSLLLGGTFAVWLATGLAGLLAHGAWPPVHFTRTPFAVRRLVSAPDDLAGAWGVGAKGGDGMPSGAMFWIVLLLLLVLLTALVVAVLITGSRYQAHRRAATTTGPAAAAARPVKRAGRDVRPSDGPAPARPAEQGARGGGAEGRRERRTATANGNRPKAPRPRPSAPPQPADGDRPHHTAPVPAQMHVPEPRTALPPLVSRHLSAQTLLDRAALIRPTLPRSTEDPLAFGLPLGAHRTHPLYGSLDQTYLLLAGPHSDKGPALLHDLLNGAPGPAVVTCPDPAALAATLPAREKLGPVLVHDPLHLTDADTAAPLPAGVQRLRWAPEGGCADPLTATNRARTLLFPLRPPGRPAMADSAIAARLSHTAAVDTAAQLLACWLHAAALDGRAFRHVHRWVEQPLRAGAREPLAVLRTASGAAAGWDGRIETLLTPQNPHRDAALTLLRRALGATSELHILQSCLPSSDEAFTPEKWESWMNERGTLYVVGEPVEDPRADPGILPLSTALLADVVEHGRRIAVGSSSGRLDPPMLLLLDDAATVAPLPSLPDQMTGGGSLGMPTVTVLRSPEQARNRWGGAAGTIHRTAGIRLAMGEVPAHDLATVLSVPESEAAALSDALRAGGPGARLVHHPAVPPVVAEPRQLNAT